MLDYPDFATGHVARWLGRLSDAGKPSPAADEQRRVANWLSTLPRENVRFISKLSKLNWHTAVGHANNWASRQHEGAQDFDSIHTLSSGWCWVRLTSLASLFYEGMMMGHCLGREAESYEGDDIYSLRDARNRPHLTLSFEPVAKVLGQVSGRAGQPLARRYHAPLQTFVTDILDVQHVWDASAFGHVYLGINTAAPRLMSVEQFLQRIRQGDKVFGNARIRPDMGPVSLPADVTWHGALHIDASDADVSPDTETAEDLYCGA